MNALATGHNIVWTFGIYYVRVRAVISKHYNILNQIGKNVHANIEGFAEPVT